MDKIAVLIPCYNEEKTVAKVVSDAKKALPEATIYVYDNNSTDQTAALARAAGAIVRKEPKQGKGNVIRSMFRDIDARCYLMVDGDDTYGLESAPELVRRVLEEGDDMAIGDRLHGAYYQENKRAFHNFGNKLVKRFVNGLFHGHISDIMTGYRAFGFAFAKTFRVASKGFDVETEMSVFSLSNHLKISELVIDYRDRPPGSVSKLSTFKDGFKVLLLIAREFRKRKPIPFYAFLFVLFAALGIGFLIPIFITFAKTGEVPQLPTLICTCMSLLVAIISLFAGFSFEESNKREAEAFQRSYNLFAYLSREED